MSEARFTIDQIKATAFKALSDTKLSNDTLASNFRGMTLLISALESSARSITDIPVIETSPAVPKTDANPEKGAAAFTGYGAKLKKQTYDRLQIARKNGVTISVIASKAKGLTETEIYTALQSGKLPFDRWELIAGALDALDKEKKNG